MIASGACAAGTISPSASTRARSRRCREERLEADVEHDRLHGQVILRPSLRVRLRLDEHLSECLDQTVLGEHRRRRIAARGRNRQLALAALVVVGQALEIRTANLGLQAVQLTVAALQLLERFGGVLRAELLEHAFLREVAIHAGQLEDLTELLEALLVLAAELGRGVGGCLRLSDERQGGEQLRGRECDDGLRREDANQRQERDGGNEEDRKHHRRAGDRRTRDHRAQHARGHEGAVGKAGVKYAAHLPQDDCGLLFHCEKLRAIAAVVAA
jgi:hypothetical protein